MSVCMNMNIVLTVVSQCMSVGTAACLYVCLDDIVEVILKGNQKGGTKEKVDFKLVFGFIIFKVLT